MGTEGAKTFEEMVRDNPNDLPTDPDALARLISNDPSIVTDDGGAPAKDDTAAQVEADAKAKADADAKAKVDADAKAKADADAKAKADADQKLKDDAAQAAENKGEKVDGVLTKDGKRVLPYGVLASERRRADEAEHGRKEAEERTAKAERDLAAARAGAAEPGKTQTETADEIAEIEKKIEALKEVPEVADVVTGLTTALAGLRARFDEFDQDRKARDERDQSNARERVQDAIEQIPQLHYWQAEKPAMWKEAIGYDRAMRENAALGHLTMEQRFERVVKVMEGIHGSTDLPANYKGTPTPTATPTPTVTPAKDEKKDTKAKIPETPITLSDLPGGVPPQGESKAIEEMSTGDITKDVNRMLDQGKSVQDIIAAYGP